MMKYLFSMIRCVKFVCVAMGAVLSVVSAAWTSPHPLAAEEEAPVSLMPFPREVQWKKAALPLAGRDEWTLRGDKGGDMVKVAWKGVLGALPAQASGRKMACTLKLDAKVLPEDARAEGYVLKVSEDGVSITAATEAGLFYGLQTLRQLVSGGKALPCCDITDYPAFDVRGFMIDCGRNFQSIESLKRQLDIASRLKVNYFHWHVTDHPGWHVESKAYPVLNDPKHRSRDEHDTYSFDQVRELIAYAKARHITIIPELDMPGHSTYFDKAFGFKMHSEEGMMVLEKLLEEFCAEIPAEDCPIIHIGADEIKIPNAKQFVERMSKKLISLNRKPMQWGGPHDLPVGPHSISQRWGEGAEMVAKSLNPETVQCHSIDSSPGYTNLFDPGLLVRRWFFMRPCGAEKGDEQKMGTLICNWPDIRVGDKSLIPLHSAQWPGLCAMAERAWIGGAADGDALPADMPAPDTEAAKAFCLFEKRMDDMRRTVFNGEHFPYWPEHALEWTLVKPVPESQKDEVRAKVLSGKLEELDTRPAYGANLYFRAKPCVGCIGMFSQLKPGNCTWAVTHIRAEKAGSAPFMIGFDAPARSSRRYSGVPLAGEWSQCGTRIWLNGVEIKNPQTYKLAGKNHYPRDTWSHPANEDPLTDDDVWWARKPTMLPLKAGDNVIVVEQPYVGEFQSWGVSLIPLFNQAKSK